MKNFGWGFKEGDVEKYKTWDEETIANELMKAREKNNKNNQQSPGQGQKNPQSNQGQGQGQQGQGSSQQGSGQGQQGQGQGQQQGQGNGQSKQQGPGQGQQGQQPQPGQGQGQGQQGEGEGQPEPDGTWDRHTISPQELIKTLEDLGLQNVLDALELPSSDDVEAIGELEKKTLARDVELIEKAASQKAQLGDKYPGGHILEAASEIVKGITEGKLDWKLGLQRAIAGEGMNFRKDMEEPADIYYVDPVDMGLDNEVYLGAEIPYKPEKVILVLIDTSGSVDSSYFRAFLSEIFTLKGAEGSLNETASEIIVLSADTVLRGEPIEITDSNMEDLIREGFKMFGRGGTDLAHSLKSALALPLLSEKLIDTVIYFTDLGDSPPQMKDMPETIKNVTYITTPDCMNLEFAKAVSDYARVYPIEKGLTVDLSADATSDMPVNVRKTKI